MPEDTDNSSESQEKPKESGEISQDDINALLAQSGAAPEPQTEQTDTGESSPDEESKTIPDESEIDTLLAQASEKPEQEQDKSAPAPADASVFTFDNVQAESTDIQKPGIDLLKDVGLNVRVELGRRKMFIEDILKLSRGAVVELDKLAGDPLDILVNDKLVAQGEVLVLNENFCIRITKVLSPDRKEE